MKLLQTFATPVQVVLEQVGREVWSGLRAMLRMRVYAVAVVVTLALGIAALSIVSHIARQVLWPRTPFVDAARTRVIDYRLKKENGSTLISRAQYAELGARLSSFEAFAAHDHATMNLVRNGVPKLMNVSHVTGQFFRISGTLPALGRAFTSEESARGDESVVILSQFVWTHSFGRERDIVGRQIELGGRMREVVGVMPDEFRSPMGQPAWDVLLPMPETGGPNAQPWTQVYVFGRLKPGVTEAQVKAELALVRPPSFYPKEYAEQLVLHAEPVANRYATGSAYVMWVMIGAAVFLHAIACVNSVTLILVRTRVRRRELGVRLALGGTLWRIRRLLLLENGLLGLVAVGVGAALAYWGTHAFIAYVNYWWLGPVRVQPELLLLNAAVVGGTTWLLVTLVPVCRAVTGDLSNAMKEGAGMIGQTRGARRWLDATVVVQAALAVMLLAGAGLMLRSLQRLREKGVGFDTTRKIAVNAKLPQTPGQPGVPQNPAEFEAKVEALRAAYAGNPSVEAIATGDFVPLTYWVSFGGEVKVEGGAPVATLFDSISPDYLRVLGIPVIRGAGLPSARGAGASGVLINEALARHCFGTADPVGQLIDVGNTTMWGPFDGEPPKRVLRQVLGMVADVRAFGQRQPPRPQLYYATWDRPAWHLSTFSYLIKLRHEVDASFEEGLRRTAYALDPNLALSTLRLDAEKEWRVSNERYALMVLRSLSGLALLLAAVGLHSVMAYAVQQRTKEFGLRMALGAEPQQIMRSVLRRGIALGAGGVAFGLGAGWWLSRFLERMLFEVSRHDPYVYGAVACVLVAIAIVASWVPALRALRTDPMATLRTE